MRKRVLSLLLAMCLAISNCPVTVRASETTEPTVLETAAETTVPETTAPETQNPTEAEESAPNSSDPTESEESQPETTEEPTVTEAPTEDPTVTEAPTEEPNLPTASEPHSEAPEESGILSADASDVVESGKCGENLTWSLSLDGTLSIRGTGPMDNYYQAPWYSYRERITSLDLAYGITTLGAGCFGSLVNLTSVVIPESVTSLEGSCFSKCTALTSVTIPSSVTNLGSHSFSDCSSLRSITIPGSVTTLGPYCFYGCTSLTNVKIPNSVTSLGDHCFAGCQSLTGMEIPDSVTSLGAYCFYSCKSLASVTIPGTIASLPDYCFYVCTNLRSVTIAEGVVSFGKGCFRDCKALASIQIPGTVKSLGNQCFGWCDALTNITIPEGVTTLPESCFTFCTSLTEITIPSTVTGIANRCFDTCTNLKRVTIPYGVTWLGYGCFYDCRSLTGVTIPNSVTSLGTSCFRGCSGLVSVKLSNQLTMLPNSCFAYCSGLSSVTIPDSVTYLEPSCFAYCSALNQVTLSKNMTRLEEYAFSNCTSLTDMVLPESIYALGRGCFVGCTGLKSINIPNGVSVLEDRSFQSCSSLTDITLSDNITSLGNSCFAGCTSLPGIELPGTLGSLGMSCFSGCESLTDITIPNNVTRLDNYVFSNCKALGSVCFQGNPPTISSYTFQDVTAYAYYPAKSTKWSPSDMKEYGGKLTWLSSEVLMPKVERDQYLIYVVDHESKPIKGATVSFNSLSAVTKDQGVVSFPRFTHTQPRITVTHSQYAPYTNEGKNYSKNESGMEIIVLNRIGPGEDGLRLESARYVDTILGAKGQSVDVLYGTKELSTSNAVGGVFDLYVCAIADDSKVSAYELIEGDNKLIASCDSSGHFQGLRIRNFTAGKSLFVRTYGTDGNATDTSINLKIVKDVPVEATSFSIGDKISFQVSSDVPFVGGSQLSLDIPDLPVEFYVASDNTIRISLNASIYDSKGEKDPDEQWEDITKTVKQIEKLASPPIASALQERIDDIVKETKEADIPGLGHASINFLGYLEGKLTPEGTGHAKGYICLTVSYTATFSGPTVMVVVVPVTYSVEVGAEGKLSAEAQYDVGTQTFSGDIKFTVTPKLSAFGGIGVGNVTGAGAYGSAKLPVEIQLLGTTTTPGLNSVKLTGELGLKAYLGPFEYQKAFLYNTWHLYTRTKGRSVSTSSESYLSGLYSQDNYEISELGYLQTASDWKGASAKAAPLGMSALQTNIYRNAQPVLGNSKNTPVLVWVSADPECNAMNASRLMYSVYRYGSWTEPAPVDAGNVTAENNPVLATAEDGTLYLAYQRSRTVLAEDASAADYAAAQEIVAARFDSTSRSFQDLTVLSSAEGYHRSPSVSADADGVAVLWVSNSDTSDLFGQNSTNAIACARKTAEGWGEPVLLADKLNTVVFARIGLVGDQLAAAVITDGDNSLATADDRTLTAYESLKTANVLAAGALAQVEFAQLPGDAASTLIWSNGANLSLWNGDYTNPLFTHPGLSSGFRVLSDRIVYASAADSGTELYALIYDGEVWSAPVAVTSQGKYLQYYDVKTIGTTTYAVATQVDATITADAVEDVCALVWCKLGSFKDLEVAAVYVEDNLASSGNAYTITADIVNNGDTPMSNFTVTAGQGYAVWGRQTFAGTLNPGTKTAVEIPMTALSQADLNKKITVTVTASGDLVTDNNSRELVTGFADLEVRAELIYHNGHRITAITTVTNNSCIPASGTLTVSCQGNSIRTLDVPQLAAGESSVYEIDLTKSSLNGKSGDMVEFKVETSAAEYDTQNNTAYLNVEITHIHAYTETVTEATCTEQGYTTFTCTCGDSYVDAYTAILPHSWDEGVVTKEPTEEENGILVYTCIRCKKHTVESVPKLEHTHSYTDAVTAPTCTEQGYTTHICACGDSYVDTYVDAAGHSFGQWYAVKEPTATEEGESRRDCSVCQQFETGTIPVISLTAPVVKSGVDGSSGKPLLTWDAVEGAGEYQIYRRAKSESQYALVHTVTENTCTDLSAKAGTSYYYRVRACRNGVVSEFGKTVSALCKLASPEVEISANTDTGKPRVSWNKVEAAAKYRVYRATSKTGTYSFLKTTVSATSYTDTTAKAGTNYYYKVKAMHKNADADSGWSNIVNRVCDLARPKVSLSVNTGTGQPIVKWKTVEGAAKYRIYRSTSENGTYELIYTGISARSYTDTAAAAGVEYFYKAKAVHKKSSADSANSDIVSRVCDLPKPVVRISLTSGGAPKLTWNQVSGAEKYYVYRASSKDGTYKKVETIDSATSFIDKEAKAGKTWYYKVKAIHEISSASSAYSSVKSIKAK